MWFLSGLLDTVLQKHNRILTLILGTHELMYHPPNRLCMIYVQKDKCAGSKYSSTWVVQSLKSVDCWRSTSSWSSPGCCSSLYTDSVPYQWQLHSIPWFIIKCFWHLNIYKKLVPDFSLIKDSLSTIKVQSTYWASWTYRSVWIAIPHTHREDRTAVRKWSQASYSKNPIVKVKSGCYMTCERCVWHRKNTIGLLAREGFHESVMLVCAKV